MLDDPELLEELANVRLRETAPGVLRMDHDPHEHDDRAIAVALAAHRLLERSPVGQVAVGPPGLAGRQLRQCAAEKMAETPQRE